VGWGRVKDVRLVPGKQTWKKGKKNDIDFDKTTQPPVSIDDKNTTDNPSIIHIHIFIYIYNT